MWMEKIYTWKLNCWFHANENINWSDHEQCSLSMKNLLLPEFISYHKKWFFWKFILNTALIWETIISWQDTWVSILLENAADWLIRRRKTERRIWPLNKCVGWRFLNYVILYNSDIVFQIASYNILLDTLIISRKNHFSISAMVFPW